ncbi:SDR family oxidoreductase [Altericroceibacterium spongiae]|uniref:SDR family oxidoreductase n=1 Tax=Altericroceibacterium spongiae TaxID=2320269 RepID=A0A420EM59_9SPHN|nr:SDR family oxidoreductase [Altericroceibacterium spongiae]RKF21763.1 SDR family oxidoreductase [Altericroceibacterium spongiae]
MTLSGKRIVIIGGSSGIGRAVASAALEEGAELFIGSSQADKVQQACQALGESASGAAIDVKQESSIANFFAQTGPFDHLVYTAGDWGSRDPKKITEVDITDFDNLLSVRFTGALLAVKHGFPQIREGGSITLTGGMVAHRPRKGAPLTTAMAGAIEHLVRGLAVDLGPVRVNAVCPGAIATDVWGENAAEQFRAFTDPLPISRLGTPEEAAEAFLYCMKGGYTTGHILFADGGKSLV